MKCQFCEQLLSICNKQSMDIFRGLIDDIEPSDIIVNVFCQIRVFCDFNNFDKKNEDVIDYMYDYMQEIYNIKNPEKHHIEILMKYIKQRSDCATTVEEFSSFAEFVSFNDCELLEWFIKTYQNKIDVIDVLTYTAYSNDDFLGVWIEIINRDIDIDPKIVKKHLSNNFELEDYNGLSISFSDVLGSRDNWRKKLNKFYEKYDLN